MAAGQHDREWPYRLGQTEDPLRQAKAGHAASAANPIEAQIACDSEPPACSGFAATSSPATAPVTSGSRPSAPAGLSATPVMTSQPPIRTNVSVITHRAAAPTAASALTESVTWSKGGCCNRAASIQPPTSSTGAAADETTPYHGTFRTIVTLGRMHRRAVVA
jgi:hypothetical protein